LECKSCKSRGVLADEGSDVQLNQNSMASENGGEHDVHNDSNLFEHELYPEYVLRIFYHPIWPIHGQASHTLKRHACEFVRLN